MEQKLAEQKIALVTGANKGIGKETARQLGTLGYHVLVGSRDAARGQAAVDELTAAGLSAELLPLVVTDPASVAAAVKTVEEKYGRLDVLINNAGVGIDFGVPASAATDWQWQETFATNLFGVVTTTNAFLPLLKKSESGRIVALSSILGSLANAANPGNAWSGSGAAYAASKAALNMYYVQLARELKDTSIKVNLAHPGYVKTDMTGGEDGPAHLGVKDGAKTSVALATLDADGPTGGYFHNSETLPW
jgi:NAD(P)-dependent dehydrogenase (short-subunit alcohol dehydrogenase family)